VINLISLDCDFQNYFYTELFLCVQAPKNASGGHWTAIINLDMSLSEFEFFNYYYIVTPPVREKVGKLISSSIKGWRWGERGQKYKHGKIVISSVLSLI